jgi:hypothetical protein
MTMNETDSDAEPRFAALVGIDWADQKHAWSLQPADSEKRQRGEVDHRPEAVESWVAMLTERFGGQPIAVALEQSRGALVFMLGKYEQLHIYPIHPRAAAQFRGALFPSGAKDDPVDAELLLDLWCIIAVACGASNRTRNKRAWCSTWSRGAAGWSARRPGSRTG